MAELNSVEELNHYYQGCILKYVQGAANVPFYAEAFYYDNKLGYIAKGSMAVYKNGALMWHPISIDASELDYSHPELGVINVDRGVVLVKRTPDRQYKKGLSERTLSLSVPIEIVQNIEGYYPVEIYKKDIINIAYGLFNPKYFSVERALSQIEAKERIASAFTKDFYIYPNMRNETLLIGYKDITVGWIKEKKAFLPKRNDYLIQELSQHIETEVVANVR